MADRFEALYPPAVMATRVVPAFRVPRFPDAEQRRNEVEVRKFYGDRLLSEYQVPGTDDRLAVIDKLFPHSRYDAMILASNDEMRSAVSDLAPASLAAVMQLAYGFVRHVSRPEVVARHDLADANLHLCFNFDRDTTDRDNAMFYDKRFHLHLNCWPARDLGSVDPVPFGSVTDPMIRRRLVDPIAALASVIICEAVGTKLHGFELRPALSPTPSDPVGLTVRLGSWSTLLDGAFHELLRALHDAADRCYRQIKEAFVGDAAPAAPWTRPSLLPLAVIEQKLESISWLTPGTRDHLLELASDLSDLDLSMLPRMRQDRAFAARKLSLNGLDYSIGFFSRSVNDHGGAILDADDVTLMMQCRLFGDVGGAGLPPLENSAAVRLDRTHGPVMTEAEIADRTAFRQSFLDAELKPLVDQEALIAAELGARR